MKEISDLSHFLSTIQFSKKNKKAGIRISQRVLEKNPGEQSGGFPGKQFALLCAVLTSPWSGQIDYVSDALLIPLDFQTTQANLQAPAQTCLSANLFR
jgi:hypothetical protein